MKCEEKITNDKTKKYFDAIASTKGVNAVSNADKYTEIRSLLRGSKTHGAVLECGGGGGFYTRRLLMDGFAVTCVDLSEKSLAENRCQAKKLGLSDQLVLVNGDFIECASNLGRQYDQVIFIKVLHHFPSLKSIEEAILVGLKMCKPGGRLVLFEPNGANVLWKVFLSLARDKNSGKAKWFYEQNLRFTTPKKLSRIMDDNNIKFSIKYHYVFPGFVLEKEFFGVGMLRYVNRLLEDSVFKKFAFNFSLTVDLEK